MIQLKKHLEIGSSPHVTDGASVDIIMRNVFLALLPVCVFSIYAFGIGAALVLATATFSCVATEHVICRLSLLTCSAMNAQHWEKLSPMSGAQVQGYCGLT